MFGASYVGFGSDPTYTQKIMKIPDIAWPTFFDSYRESMLRVKSRKDKQFFPKHSSCRMSAVGRITYGSRITYYSLIFFIAYAFKGHVHAFAGRVKVLSQQSCRTSAIFKYFCPKSYLSLPCQAGKSLLNSNQKKLD